jgi:hypothetical protein
LLKLSENLVRAFKDISPAQSVQGSQALSYGRTIFVNNVYQTTTLADNQKRLSLPQKRISRNPDPSRFFPSISGVCTGKVKCANQNYMRLVPVRSIPEDRVGFHTDSKIKRGDNILFSEICPQWETKPAHAGTFQSDMLL